MTPEALETNRDIIRDSIQSGVQVDNGLTSLRELVTEIERLQAELAAQQTAVEIICSRKPGAAANVVREDYPEIAGLIDGAFERVEKELEQAKERLGVLAVRVVELEAATDRLREALTAALEMYHHDMNHPGPAAECIYAQCDEMKAALQPPEEQA